MIRFIVTPGHVYTLRPIHKPPAGVTAPPIETQVYRNLFEAERLPAGTWIFCDLERLGMWELRLAGEIARLIREAGPGFRVLNDPARAASRYELLLRLHEHGFNHFRAWRAEEGIPPARYPVFLRLESDHRKPLTGLIETPAQLAQELGGLASRGIARRLVLIVEYQAEELVPGIFRKFAAYRFGDRVVADHLVHDVSWVAKYGTADAWNDERFAEEAAYVRDNPHAEALMRAFDIAGIDYGRADYGIVGGVPQVWEINTNPQIPGGNTAKVPPARLEATVTARENRMAALAAMETGEAGDGWVALNSEFLTSFRERQIPGNRELFRE